VDYEIANVVLSKLRRDELDEPAATDALDLYRTMDLERHSVEPRAVLALAVRTRLTAYDAAYLWLAQGLNAPLATFDGRLGAIAVEHLRKGG
jgi:predicted nucleic acid-binding protein